MKKIKDVSKISGLSKRTLQYYDEKKLLRVKRTKENYRLYDDSDLERLWVIILYKEIGFKLDEIQSLLKMSDADAKETIQRRIHRISDEISKLNQQKRLAKTIKQNGIPLAPLKADENAEVTYAEAAQNLKTTIASDL